MECQGLAFGMVSFFPFEEDYTSRRIKEFSTDGQFAFVEGSTTGLPVKELSVVDTPQETQHLPEVRATKGKVLPSLGRTPVWNDIPVSPDRIMGVNAIGHVTQGGLPATHQRLIPGTTGTEGKEIYLSTALSWT